MKKNTKKFVLKLAVILGLLGISLEVGAQTVSACCWWWRPPRPCYPVRPCPPRPCPPKPKPPVVPKEIAAPTVYTLTSGATEIKGLGLPNRTIVAHVITSSGKDTFYSVRVSAITNGFTIKLKEPLAIGDKVKIYQCYERTAGVITEKSSTMTLEIATYLNNK